MKQRRRSISSPPKAPPRSRGQTTGSLAGAARIKGLIPLNFFEIKINIKQFDKINLKIIKTIKKQN